MSKKKPTILHVEWVDSVSPSSTSWQDLEQVAALSASTLCTSVGRLVCEDKVYLSLAGSWHEDEYHGVIAIPKVSVTKMRKIG